MADFCPEPNPHGEDAVGRCHLCKETKPISCCNLCEHWFCGSCRAAYWHRGLEAIKQMVAGPTPGCCGPDKEIANVEG